MGSFDLPGLAELDQAAIVRFRANGFLIVQHVLDDHRIEALRARFPKLFAGPFDTGVYPDEWYWREGMSLPDLTRHMANAWKAELSVARLALSGDVGRAAAQLAGWSGARLGQDTIWWKAPKTKPIAHHQDTSFTDFLDPPAMVTCWVIYRRYQRTGDPGLDESFFPVLWSRAGSRTGWIEAYCATGRRSASPAHA